MQFVNKFIALALLMSLINFYVPANIYAAEEVQKLESDIIEYEPASSTTVEKKLPSTSSGGKWLWAIIGAALIGGVAAAMGGGSGGGGGDDDGGGDDVDNTGDLNYSW